MLSQLRAQLEHDLCGGQDVRRHVGRGDTMSSEDEGLAAGAAVNSFQLTVFSVKCERKTRISS